MAGELRHISSSEVARELAMRSAETRRATKRFKESIARGEVGVEEAFDSPLVARVRVVSFLQCFRGIGPTIANDFMSQAHVAPDRRVGGLGPHQREKLIDLVGRVRERYE